MSKARCVLVTGANRGIGLEFVHQYADSGYRVLATCRDPDNATDLRDCGGDVEVQRLDVASDEDVDHIIERLNGAPIDILICNAAVLGGPRSRLHDLDWAGWRQVLEVNLLGAMRVAIRLWSNVAASEERKIVFLSSRAGLPREARPNGSYVYRSSKAALNTAARSLALDLDEKGVVVALLNPGHVRTRIGGRDAPMSAGDSVSRMREVIAAMGPAHSGRFWHFDGTELPL
jgi:NAD(P)-dependent dehydrogenase (short-subunit alcohol dehydrogenase family)